MRVNLLPPVVIIGGGEHAQVVADAIRAGGRHRLIGFTDRERNAVAESKLGVPWLGTDAWLEDNTQCAVVLGLGSTRSTLARRELVERIRLPAERWASVVHPSAVVAPSATIMHGAVVMARAVVNTHARVGAHALVNTGAIVEHDVEIAAHVVLGPGTLVGGGTRIEAGTYIGMGAIIRDHTSIGACALIAMGAVVTRPVPAEATVSGIPARLHTT